MTVAKGAEAEDAGLSERRAPRADPARGLALLWGSHTREGRSGLTIAAIVAATIEIADADGLDAVSMRRVAERLGAGTMSLYTHIPGKRELTDLMIDTVMGQLYADVDEPVRQSGGWRGGLEFITARNWYLYRRHPWLAQVNGARPVLGPHATLKYEAELRPLDGIGLTDVEMDSVLTLVLTHVAGVAGAWVNQIEAERESGQSDVEWWVQTAPLLAAVIDGDRFPVASRVGQAAGEAYQAVIDPQHALEFGLERILDGVAVLIASRATDVR